MSLGAINTSNGYEYELTFGGSSMRVKRDGRRPTTSGIVGNYENGYDTFTTFGGTSYRQKRKGRIPSVSFYPAYQTTKVVEDHYVIQSFGATVEAEIPSYDSQNEIDEEEEL